VDVVAGEYDERLRNHPLLKYSLNNENMIVTPHIGGYTRESTVKTEVFLASRLVTYITKLG